jgi:hypothetical protein
MIGGEPHTQWLPAEIARDAQSYVLTGHDVVEANADRWDLLREPVPLETSSAGVFATGDLRHGSIKRVASAVGEGATVVRVLNKHLRAAEPPRDQCARSEVVGPKQLTGANLDIDAHASDRCRAGCYLMQLPTSRRPLLSTGCAPTESQRIDRTRTRVG